MDVAATTAHRITIVPDSHGRITRDGRRSEPDISWISGKWLERHSAGCVRVASLNQRLSDGGGRRGIDQRSKVARSYFPFPSTNSRNALFSVSS
jgi:hypothetical protein